MRIFIYGYGSIGRRHHKILQELAGDVEADISDPYHLMFSKPNGDYDVGLICADTARHLDLASLLKGRCKLLFIEKPLHSSVGQIQKFSSILKDEPVHVGCNVRYTSAVQQLNNCKDTARMVRVTSMSNLLKWRNDPNKQAYSFHKSKGGGVLIDFIHEPDYISYVFGAPNNVVVSERRLHNNVTFDSADSCAMIWEYEKSTVTFNLSYSSKEYIRKIEVLNEDCTTQVFELTKESLEASYKLQWQDILATGPKNSYEDCLKLYQKILPP